jgi:hypothetical protein
MGFVSPRRSIYADTTLREPLLGDRRKPGYRRGNQPQPAGWSDRINGTRGHSNDLQRRSFSSTMESRILSLREAVTSGQYGLEPNEIADAMLSDGM